MLDIGFVGGGTVARWHGDTLDALGVPIEAIADPASDVRTAFAARYDVSATYDGYEEMLAAENLDIVVAVPNAIHAEPSIAALEAGATVLCEKPLADSLENAERIADAETDAPGTVIVGFMRAFEPPAVTAREMVADGELGDVYEIDLENVRRRGVPRIGSWFTRAGGAGGGALLDIGVHVLHLGLFGLGFPAVEAVSATAGTHFGDRSEYTYLRMRGGDPLEDPEFSVEDSVRALIRTADATIHLRCAWAINGEPTRRVRVFGDRAGVEFAPGDDGLAVYGTDRGGLVDERLSLPPLPGEDALEDGPGGAFTAQWEYVLGVAAGERTHSRNTVAEGLAVQRVVEAIYESAETDSEVTVSEG